MASFQRSVTELLPAELWIKIFEDVILPPANQRSAILHIWAEISLTCRTFRSYLLPMIYEGFFFHSFILSAPSGFIQRSMPSIETIEREADRLAFYLSDRIVGYVHGICCTGWQLDQAEPTTVPHAYDKDYLSSQLFDSVHKFRNLTILSCVCIDFDSSTIQKLSQLPNLEGFYVNNCNLQLTPLDTPLHLNLKNFCVNHAGMLQVAGLGGHGIEHWLGLLDADRLTWLFIADVLASAPFLHHISSTRTFTSLNDLHIYITSSTIPYMQCLLSKSPNLRTLDITMPEAPLPDEAIRLCEGLEAFHAPPMPFLKELQGPPELLHAILSQKLPQNTSQYIQLEQLRITSIWKEGLAFEAIWNRISSPTWSIWFEHLTHFTTKFQFIEQSYFPKLLNLFPNLQALALEAANELSQAKVTHGTFLDDICLYSLSSNLRSLSIDWSSDKDEDLITRHHAAKINLFNSFHC
ncbi:hypothetical protein CPB84DRAFT_1853520 [Gymnopilus junonius]|uniref:F-box domain-containing protein n=1 Tax=Gymnopilus junonius TaxID=109634 RepID=A0A9P5NC31_GYMJU|nr:hypothetical protein CPB84DRAFT_1853520 [Gymnopilus junonius]